MSGRSNEGNDRHWEIEREMKEQTPAHHIHHARKFASVAQS
jgi:hypothetical protein